jgi:hypothetical protein
VTNVLRDEVTLSIFDVDQANFSLASLPAWALGNMFMLMGTQKTVASIFDEVLNLDQNHLLYN